MVDVSKPLENRKLLVALGGGTLLLLVLLFATV